jgi:NADPH-dependent glutamate synthase beta subunit-like oxidoreductase/ferredoxin
MPKLNAYEQLAIWREKYPAPCQAACPVHTNARAYVTLTAEGRFEEAFVAARGPNPLAAICGRACSAPCEDVCTRREVDRPIRIRQLKRFLTDRFEAAPLNGRGAPPTGQAVAVIGAGPAGLAAAEHLAFMGHAVSVFEAAPEAGGMALLGVPRFRLSHQAIQRDLRAIEGERVTIRTSTRVGADVSLDELRAQFQAVFVATGTMRLNALEISGMDLEGVVQAIPFLETANLGGRPACGNRVAVLGGGYTAMDAARTAVRLGADATHVVYRRTRAETEVHDEELDETLHEGVVMEFLVSPVRFVGDGQGRLAGVECIRNRLGEPDASGRPRPLPIEGSEFVFECDMAILALGQSPDPSGVDEHSAALLRDVDPETSMTVVPGVFAGGDFVSGASTIIEAVAAGKAIAASIHRYLKAASQDGAAWAEPAELVPVIPLSLDGTAVPAATAGTARGLALDVEVERTFAEIEARAEGMRCLYCGLLPTIVLDHCTACVACVLVCPVDAIHKVALTPDGATASPTGERDVLAYQIMPEECIRCGRCMSSCPTDAIVITNPD